MEETPATVPRRRLTDDRPDGLLVLLLAFLIPGSGHALLGRLSKGISFFLIIGFMFTVGIVLEGRLYDFDLARPLSVIATIASHGSGLFDLSARFAGWTGNGLAPTYEYGTAFILTAGLMNLLLILDVWAELSGEDTELETETEAFEDRSE